MRGTQLDGFHTLSQVKIMKGRYASGFIGSELRLREVRVLAEVLRLQPHTFTSR